MIKLNENYTINTDTTHGFTLVFESNSFEKEVLTKQGKEIREVTTKDTWYYPKLSQALSKFFSLNLRATNQKELLEKVIKIESNIEKFNNIFAKKGKTFNV